MHLIHARSAVVAVLMAALAAASSACSGDPSSSGAGGQGGTGGAELEPVGCADDIVWSAAAALSPARDHHATFGFELDGQGFVYVTGGWNYQDVFSDASVAAVGDGSVDVAWQASGALPEKRAGHAVSVVDGRVFLAAGQRPGAFLASVIAADIQPGGGLGPWEQATPLPEGRFHMAMVSAGGQLIATGGLDQASFSAIDTVFSAPVLDGQLGAWQASNLPVTLSHHASFVAGKYIYLAGGLRGSPAGDPTLLAEVWRAPLLDLGVGPWEQVADLPATRTTHAAFVRGRCAYIAAGFIDGYTYGDEVMAASFDEEGNLGAWHTLPTRLPAGRSHMHQVALVQDRAYLLGGSLGYQNVTGDAAVGSFVHN